MKKNFRIKEYMPKQMEKMSVFVLHVNMCTLMCKKTITV